MHRRSFLVLASASITVAFDEPTSSAPRPPSPLVAAWARARTSGRSVVALLVRDASDGRREYAWTSFLALADDDVLAELELCDVVLATSASANDLWPAARIVPEEPPLAVVATPSLLDERFTSIEVYVPELHAPWTGSTRPAWCASIAKALHAALALDGLRFDVRAKRALGGEPASRADAVKELARRLRDEALPGARWGYPVGCGGGPCGMGSVHDESRRFLELYVDRRDRRDPTRARR